MKCSLKIAAPSYFYMQRDITHKFSGVLEKCLWESLFLVSKIAGQQTASLLKRYCFTVIFQVFYEYIFKLFRNTCFLAHTSEWLLPVCGKCTSQERCVKICVKEGSTFLFVFVFWGSPFCTTFYFNFLKLGIAPLMLKIIYNILLLFLFNLKTQISFYILIDDFVTGFLKCLIFCYIIFIVLIVLGQK